MSQGSPPGQQHRCPVRREVQLCHCCVLSTLPSLPPSLLQPSSISARWGQGSGATQPPLAGHTDSSCLAGELGKAQTSLVVEQIGFVQPELIGRHPLR